VCAGAGSALQLLQCWLAIENTLKEEAYTAVLARYLPIFFCGQEPGGISQRLRGLQGLQGLRFCHMDALFQEIESRLQSKIGWGGESARARAPVCVHKRGRMREGRQGDNGLGLRV
jgi:hypothetical protein